MKKEEFDETFEDLWWGTFDNNGEKNSFEYEKLKKYIDEAIQNAKEEEMEKWRTAVSYSCEPEEIERITNAVNALNK